MSKTSRWKLGELDFRTMKFTYGNEILVVYVHLTVFVQNPWRLRLKIPQATPWTSYAIVILLLR